MFDYYAYIDEAGDEGFGKLRAADCGGQSRWLLLGAILVRAENERLLPKWRDEITHSFPNKRNLRNLHFIKLKHEQRVVACRLLSEKRLGISVICSDKKQILPLRESDPKLYEKYKSKGHLYNYLVRYLLERLTTACASQPKNGRPPKLKIIFSKRGGTDYAKMRDYLFLMKGGKEVIVPKRSIDWSVFHPEDIEVENHKNRAGLQIADVVTSATYQAFEPNSYGDVETRYVQLLARKNRFIRAGDRNSVMDAGITLVPRKAEPHADTMRFIQTL